MPEIHRFISPDDAHEAYAVQNDEKWHIAVDGIEGKTSLDSFLKGAPIGYTAADQFQTLGLGLLGPEFVQLRVNIRHP